MFVIYLFLINIIIVKLCILLHGKNIKMQTNCLTEEERGEGIKSTTKILEKLPNFRMYTVERRYFFSVMFAVKKKKLIFVFNFQQLLPFSCASSYFVGLIWIL